MDQFSNSFFVESYHADNDLDGDALVANFPNGLFSVLTAAQNDKAAEQTLPIILNSPHSGREYPQSFIQGSHLSSHQLRKSEDYYVDALFSQFILDGAPMIRANFPRAYLDLNREPYELDQKLFAEKLPPHANSNSIRVANGLGTIARIVSEGMPIYKAPLTLEAAYARIDRLYQPYHNRLGELLANTHQKFGFSILVDCHSMPSNCCTSKQGSTPDMIIGDRFGASCDGELSQALMGAFKERGYHVVLNRPFAGGFNCEHYGRPMDGLHGVQIEINRGLYVDETTYVPNENFKQLQNDIHFALNAVKALPEGCFYGKNLAAE